MNHLEIMNEDNIFNDITYESKYDEGCSVYDTAARVIIIFQEDSF